MSLKVKIIEGVDIPKMDVVGHSDPFCMVQMSSSPNIFRTKVINNTAKPVWNEEFTLPVANRDTDVLHILLKDHDEVSSDDAIGRIQIPLTSLKANDTVEQWYKLEPALKKDSAGSIRVACTLICDKDGKKDKKDKDEKKDKKDKDEKKDKKDKKDKDEKKDKKDKKDKDEKKDKKDKKDKDEKKDKKDKKK